MASFPQLPVLFLACVNSYQRGRRLRYLVQERKSITRLIGTPSIPYYQAIEKGNRPHNLFLQWLPQEQDRITHLHLVGHTDDKELRVESDKFEVPVSQHALGQLIDLLPNLTCVYLSGCATPALLDLFLRKDVPAVIVTRTHSRNHVATSIAETFYAELAQGASVWKAFETVQVEHAGVRAFPVKYHIDSDEMKWLDKEESGSDLSWGMYYLPENLPRLSQAPPSRQIIPYGDTRQRRWSPRRVMRYALTAVSLGLLAVTIALYLRDAHSWHQFLAFW
jgi:hypothetical protein